MTAEIEAEDGIAFLLELLRQFVPTPVPAAAADVVQQEHARGLCGLVAGVEGSFQLDLVHCLETDFFRLALPAGGWRQQGKGQTGQQNGQQAVEWQTSHVRRLLESGHISSPDLKPFS